MITTKPRIICATLLAAILASCGGSGNSNNVPKTEFPLASAPGVQSTYVPSVGSPSDPLAIVAPPTDPATAVVTPSPAEVVPAAPIDTTSQDLTDSVQTLPTGVIPFEAKACGDVGFLISAPDPKWVPPKDGVPPC